MTRDEILTEAGRLISGDRAALYGDAGEMWRRIAAIWSVRVGAEISPALALSMMANVKQIRADLGRACPDNAIDACGYEALAGELRGREAGPDDSPASETDLPPVSATLAGGTAAFFRLGEADGSAVIPPSTLTFDQFRGAAFVGSTPPEVIRPALAESVQRKMDEASLAAVAAAEDARRALVRTGVAEPVADAKDAPADPDWPALFARIDRGEKCGAVAESAGVPMPRLRSKYAHHVKARAAAAGASGEAAERGATPTPAPAGPDAPKAEVAHKLAAAAGWKVSPAAPDPAPEAPAEAAPAPVARPSLPESGDVSAVWTPEADLRLLKLLSQGFKCAAVARELNCGLGEVKARFGSLCPTRTWAEQMKVIRRLEGELAGAA